jgi:translation initiation factor 3 subunit M
VFSFFLFHFTLAESNVSLLNLFNTLPRTSALRLSVYQSLLALADSNESLDALELRISDVEKWLSEWEISETAKASFLKSITDAYTKAEQPYVLKLPRSSFRLTC